MEKNTKSTFDGLDKRIIRSHAKKHSYKLYEIGDKVYVRCKKEKGKKKLTKHIIEVRLITKRCQDDTNHNIRTEGPGHLLMKSENWRSGWLSVWKTFKISPIINSNNSRGAASLARIQSFIWSTSKQMETVNI